MAPFSLRDLNRAVAVTMRDSLLPCLNLVDAIFAREDLKKYRLALAAQADLCRRQRRTAEARTSYRRPLNLTQQEPERRFLKRRMNALPD